MHYEDCIRSEEVLIIMLIDVLLLRVCEEANMSVQTTICYQIQKDPDHVVRHCLFRMMCTICSSYFLALCRLHFLSLFPSLHIQIEIGMLCEALLFVFFGQLRSTLPMFRNRKQKLETALIIKADQSGTNMRQQDIIYKFT